VHLSRLVEDLRLLALAETGTLRLDIQAVRLDEALAKSVEAFKLRAEEKRVVLTLRVPDSLPPVTMDRTRFAQVMENLLANALQHTPEGGSVSISAELAEPDSVRVTVADTGEGIPEDALPRIFERFYRVDPSRSRDTGGTGLGLAIAKYLIEAQGGTIGVESIFGEGSRFILMLRVGNQGYQEGQA
jgi:signal transduction histidine kinase